MSCWHSLLGYLICSKTIPVLLGTQNLLYISRQLSLLFYHYWCGVWRRGLEWLAYNNDVNLIKTLSSCENNCIHSITLLTISAVSMIRQCFYAETSIIGWKEKENATLLILNSLRKNGLDLARKWFHGRLSCIQRHCLPNQFLFRSE